MLTTKTINNIQAILVMLAIILGVFGTASLQLEYKIITPLVVMALLVLIFAAVAWLEEYSKKY